MPQSHAIIIVHIVFATKNRQPTIPPHKLKNLHAYISTLCHKEGARVFQVGGIEDHVHIACTLPRTITLAKLVQNIKRISSRWLAKSSQFQWQDGYGAYSVSESHLPNLIHYIKNQRQHHTSPSPM